MGKPWTAEKTLVEMSQTRNVHFPHGITPDNNLQAVSCLAIIAGSLQRIADVMEWNAPEAIEKRKRDGECNAAKLRVVAWMSQKPPILRIPTSWVAMRFVEALGPDADPKDRANWIALANAKGIANFGNGRRRAVREWIDKVFPQ